MSKDVGVGGVLDCEMRCRDSCDNVDDFEAYNECVNACIKECAEALERPMKR